MPRRYSARLCFAVFVFLAPMALLQAQQDERPNIVLILADDLGYTDISPFGSEINTPNIARLAAEQLSFTGTPFL